MQYVVEGAIAISLLAVVSAIVVITVVSGADSLAATRLPDLGFALAGGLAGVAIPKALNAGK